MQVGHGKCFTDDLSTGSGKCMDGMLCGLTPIHIPAKRANAQQSTGAMRLIADEVCRQKGIVLRWNWVPFTTTSSLQNFYVESGTYLSVDPPHKDTLNFLYNTPDATYRFSMPLTTPDKIKTYYQPMICSCGQEYTNSGICEDINECNEKFVCPELSNCVNKENGYECHCNAS